VGQYFLSVIKEKNNNASVFAEALHYCKVKIIKNFKPQKPYPVLSRSPQFQWEKTIDRVAYCTGIVIEKLG